MSFLFDPDPEAFEPLIRYKDIDAHDYEESWSEELVMYDNPLALFPTEIEAFSDISRVFYDKVRGFTCLDQPYEVLNSMTFCFTNSIDKK